MKTTNALLLLFFVFYASICAYAEENTDPGAGISIGITGLFGTNTLKTSSAVDEFEPGYITGGGIVLQKRLARYLSACSGVEYRYFEFDFNFYDSDTSMDIDASWKFKAISSPFHLIATIKGPSSSLDLHAGMTYTYIFSSEMVTKDSLLTGINKDDAMRFTNSSQIAASGGLVMRFAVTTYSDIFLGIMSEYYFTELLKIKGDDENLNLLNYAFTAGYLFRTDLF